MAKIPLIGLAHDKDIKGSFELTRPDGAANGALDITLYWQHSYLPPSASTFAPSGSKAPSSSAKPTSLAQRAKQMGVALPKAQPSPAVSRRGSARSQEASAPVRSVNASAQGNGDNEGWVRPIYVALSLSIWRVFFFY